MSAANDSSALKEPKVIFHDMTISSFCSSAIKLNYSFVDGVQQSPDDYIGLVSIGENNPEKCLLKKKVNTIMSSSGTVMFNIAEICKDEPLAFQFIYVDSNGAIVGRSFNCGLEKCGSSSPSDTTAVVPMQEYEQLLLQIIKLSEKKQKLLRVEKNKEKVNNNIGPLLIRDDILGAVKNEKELEEQNKDRAECIKAIEKYCKRCEENVVKAKKREDEWKTVISMVNDERNDMENKLKPQEIVAIESLFDLEEKCEAVEKSIELIARNVKIQEIVKSELKCAIINLTTIEKDLTNNWNN